MGQAWVFHHSGTHGSDQTRAYTDSCAWAEQSLPVLILLDLYLPKSEAGFSLLQSLKKNRWFTTIPIIVMSRSSAVENIKKAYSYASNGYMVKPEGLRDWREAFSLPNQYWQGDSSLL